MIIPKQKPINDRIFNITIALLSLLVLMACASYPNDPRSPQSGQDTYTVEEDGFLSVPLENGILINDKPREGARIFLRTTGEQETEAGGLMVLAEDGSFTYEPAEDFFGNDAFRSHPSRGSLGISHHCGHSGESESK